MPRCMCASVNSLPLCAMRQGMQATAGRTATSVLHEQVQPEISQHLFEESECQKRIEEGKPGAAATYNPEESATAGRKNCRLRRKSLPSSTRQRARSLRNILISVTTWMLTGVQVEPFWSNIQVLRRIALREATTCRCQQQL